MQNEKAYWNYSKDEILKAFNVTEDGLKENDAERILEKEGENVLKDGKKKSVLRVFGEQFCDLLVIILIAAAVISMLSKNASSAVVIIVVLVMNAVLGTIEHEKAQKSLESLKKLSAPETKVIRDKTIKAVPSKMIVPGDIVLLEAGDMVAADGYILNNYSLQVNESSLTGESSNVEKESAILEKNTALADRTNMVFSGSLVTYGRAQVLVTATGMNTEIGKIAALMNLTKERKTPLQESLDKFSKKLALFITAVSVIVFILGLYRNMKILDALMFAVALAVAAIPEALGSIVTIVQAFGTQKMARENAVIKNLKAVESLGCVSVICSDKTGTLTQNKMTVQKLYADGNIFDPDEFDLENFVHRYLLFDAVLANDSSIADGRGIGDPTEYALIEMCRKIRSDNVKFCKDGCMSDEILREKMLRVEEIPFDSERKLMSTKHCIDGIYTVFTKGAADVLIDRCDYVCYSDGTRKMTDEEKQLIRHQNKIFSENGLRVLAFAYKEMTEKLDMESENGFTFLGLISMADPPREESKKAVKQAKEAGIKPVMITGDHKTTAVAIASKIGIYSDGDLAYTGAQLDEIDDAQLQKDIEKISVYARVSPEHKIRIVNAWQNKKKIVAMTGDGVNDAPALKKADVGVAMGITGTEVAKDAAGMILMDDNFATIIKAVANGRNVYQNIKNAILFLLSGNTAAIFCVLYTSVMGMPVPFAPVHLLFINLLTDSLPALAIGMEQADARLLKEKPRDPSEGILTKSFLRKMLLQGMIIAIVTMGAYFIGVFQSASLASTMAFATLTLARLFHGFNCRKEGSLFKIGILTNRYSIYAFLAGILLLSCVIFIAPLRSVFSVAQLTVKNIGLIVLSAVLPTVIIQAVKLIREKKESRE